MKALKIFRLTFIALLLAGCGDEGGNVTNLWYENINGQFELVKETTSTSYESGYSFKNQETTIDGIKYLWTREISHYSCGFFQSCSSQVNKYYEISSEARNFVKLDNDYAKDLGSVYYAGMRIESSDPSTFKRIDDNYSKDYRNIYFKDKKLQNADISTFQVMDIFPYSKDHKQVYYKNIVIQEADPESFMPPEKDIYRKSWGHDDHNFFYFDQKIPVVLDVNEARTVIKSGSSRIYTDGQKVILATYASNPNHNKSITRPLEECLKSNPYRGKCLKAYEVFENFKQKNDVIIVPQDEEATVLGIKDLDIPLPITNFSRVAFFDHQGYFYYFNEGSELVRADFINEKNINMLDYTCKLPNSYTISIDCDENKPNKEEQYNYFDLFEDDQFLYAMSIQGKENSYLIDFQKILKKNNAPVYWLDIDSSDSAYLLQGDILHEIAINVWERDAKITFESIKIDGELYGVFYDYPNKEPFFVDNSGIIRSGSTIENIVLYRDSAQGQLDGLKVSDLEKDSTYSGMFFENDMYIFYLAKKKKDVNLIINKETGMINQLFESKPDDLRDKITVEFLDYLNLKNE